MPVDHFAKIATEGIIGNGEREGGDPRNTTVGGKGTNTRKQIDRQGKGKRREGEKEREEGRKEGGRRRGKEREREFVKPIQETRKSS